MGEDFVLASRNDIVHHIPVVVGIGYHRETGVRINFSQHTLNESDFITINCVVSSHYRVLSGNCTNTDFVFGALSIVVVVQIRQSRNGRGLIERQEPRSRATSCIFQAAHTTETKVSHCHIRIGARSSLGIELVSYLMVLPTNSSICTHRPHFSLEQTLKPLDNPSETRVSISHFNNGNAHIYNRAFGNCTDFNRQITQLMQFDDTVSRNIAQTQVSIDIMVILIHNLLDGFIEEVCKTLLHILDERLNAIYNHLREIIIHCLTSSQIGHQISLIVRVHQRVALLIRVTVQHNHLTKIHSHFSF